jgi:cytidine deaminase
VTAPPVDWAALRAAAAEVARRAYMPYSGFPVGAAGLVDDGRLVVGCNVENASYGLTLCAECGLVSSLHATGGGRLVAVAVTDPGGHDLACCGRCRQLLFEAGGADLLVNERPLRDWLPDAFGPDDLEGADDPHDTGDRP